MKKLLLTQIAFMLIFLFCLPQAKAQANVHPIKSKTVVYTLKKQHEQNGLTAQQAVDIDKLLNSKKGILSSVTHAANRTVTVLVEGTFPHEIIKELLGSMFKMDVESIQVTENTN